MPAEGERMSFKFKVLSFKNTAHSDGRSSVPSFLSPLKTFKLKP